jgi:hypothetical protein
MSEIPAAMAISFGLSPAACAATIAASRSARILSARFLSGRESAGDALDLRQGRRHRQQVDRILSRGR